MMKKIFFLGLMILLFFANPAFGVLTVPQGSPLQPIPLDTGPSYNQNVNSDDSIYSKSQRIDQEQIAPPSPSSGGESAAAPVSVPVADSVAVSDEPIIIYWIFLIAGFVGLVGSLAWIYFRFREK